MIQVTPSLVIPESELSERFVRASGPGGQNVNKVETKVELSFDIAGSPTLDGSLTTLGLDNRAVLALSVGTSPLDAKIVQHNMLPVNEPEPVAGEQRRIVLPSVAVRVPAHPVAHALLIAAGTLWISPLMQEKPAYDPIRDFAPVSFIETKPYVLVVHPSVPVKSGPEWVISKGNRLHVRTYDTDYVFRPHTAFAWLTGLGADREPDAVLVLEPVGSDDGAGPVAAYLQLYDGLAHGQTLGSYVIVREIGRGGMGEVRAARDITLGRDVAVKLLHESLAGDDSWGEDLVVVGNKGMTGASRFLHTSVPNKVSHHAPIALLIVRTT